MFAKVKKGRKTLEKAGKMSENVEQMWKNIEKCRTNVKKIGKCRTNVEKTVLTNWRAPRKQTKHTNHNFMHHKYNYVEKWVL